MTDFIGVVYPPDDAVEYTYVDKNGNVITSHWWFPGPTVEYVRDNEKLNELGPEWVEIGHVSEEDLDPIPSPDYPVTSMRYTSPLTVIPTGDFRIRPEDVTGYAGEQTREALL